MSRYEIGELLKSSSGGIPIILTETLTKKISSSDLDKQRLVLLLCYTVIETVKKRCKSGFFFCENCKKSLKK